MTGGHSSPTVHRRRLGAELRRHREAAGLTIDDVARSLHCSASKISRIETGQTTANLYDVHRMLSLYNIADDRCAQLLEVARQTHQRGWWAPFGAVLTGTFIGFESAARSIRSYETLCVPGLLQTEAYARSVLSAGLPGMTPAELDSRVKVRMARQALLTRDEPASLWAILDEAALHRPVGGAAVMRDQLRRLVVTAEWSNVTLQILPFQVGAHVGMDGSFVILEFSDQADPDTVFIAMATGGIFQEKTSEVACYRAVFASLQRLALTPRQSLALVAEKSKEYS